MHHTFLPIWMPLEVLRAYIALIPKEEKALTQCGSHRPIALLNADLKLFAKFLANRLLPNIPRLIHRDQAGFVPMREPRQYDSGCKIDPCCQNHSSSPSPDVYKCREGF